MAFRADLRVPAAPPVPPDEDIARAAAALLAAERVVIVAGEGAVLSGAGAEVLALGEALAAPIATSLGARGIVPTRHPLSVGVAGNYAAPPANQIVHGADRVIFIGCDTGDQVTHTWRIPKLDTLVVQIDMDAGELGRNYPNTIGLLGYPKSTLTKLIAAVGRPKPRQVASLRPGEAAASPHGVRRWRRCWPATPKRSVSSGCAPKLPRPCRPMASWSRTPATPESGPAPVWS